MRKLHETGSSTGPASAGVRGGFSPGILPSRRSGNHTPPAPPALQTPPEKNTSRGRNKN